jgi:hypothetical protein
MSGQEMADGVATQMSLGHDDSDPSLATLRIGLCLAWRVKG